MTRFRRTEIIEPYYPPLFVRETSIFAPAPSTFSPFVEEEIDLSFALDLLKPKPSPSPFEVLESTFTDLIQIERTPSFSSYKRIQQRSKPEFSLESLCDRVSLLESRFDRLLSSKFDGEGRKYTLTAEIEGGSVDRKYKWTAEIKDGKKKEKVEKKVDNNYKWTAKIKKDEGPISRTYTFEASSGDASECSKSDKKDKKTKKKGGSETRIVEIEDPADHRAIVLRHAVAKRTARRNKGKMKELSPQDAALLIQMTFRAYLIRRSQALRGLRDLAIAKAKLKEIRALFNNFSYRRHISRDAEERQKFSERIIVLLLTVDAIEGSDRMVRSAKRSMVDELEAMLDVVDPQPAGRSLSMRRRTFDMPDGAIQKELAAGVSQVVEMLNHEENNDPTLEACL